MEQFSILNQDVLEIILDFATSFCNRMIIRTVCSEWNVRHKEVTKGQIIRKLKPQYLSLTDLGATPHLWLPYIGSAAYYTPLLISLGAAIKSPNLYIIEGRGTKCLNFWLSEEEASLPIKRVHSTLRNFERANWYELRARRPLILEKVKKCFSQRESISKKMNSFTILVPAETKVIKDLTPCNTCNRICKHRKVNIGSNCIEEEVIIHVDCIKGEYSIVSEGIKEETPIVNDSFSIDVVRDKEEIARITKHLRAAKDLDYSYIKYSLRDGQIWFIKE